MIACRSFIVNNEIKRNAFTGNLKKEFRQINKKEFESFIDKSAVDVLI